MARARGSPRDADEILVRGARDTGSRQSKSLGLTEEARKAAQSFVYSLHRRGVRKTQMPGRAEGFAGRDRYVFACEKLLGDGGGVWHLRIAMSRDIGKHVKRAHRRSAGDSRNRAEAGKDALAAARIFREHGSDRIH